MSSRSAATVPVVAVCLLSLGACTLQPATEEEEVTERTSAAIASQLAGDPLVGKSLESLAARGCALELRGDERAQQPIGQLGYTGYFVQRSMCSTESSQAVLLVGLDPDGHALLAAGIVGDVATQNDGARKFSTFHAFIDTVDGSREELDDPTAFELAWRFHAEEIYGPLLGVTSSASPAMAAEPVTDTMPPLPKGLADASSEAAPEAMTCAALGGGWSCAQCQAWRLTQRYTLQTLFDAAVCDDGADPDGAGTAVTGSALACSVLPGSTCLSAVAALHARAGGRSVCGGVVEHTPLDQDFCHASCGGACEAVECFSDRDCSPARAADLGLAALQRDDCTDPDDPGCYDHGECRFVDDSSTWGCVKPDACAPPVEDFVRSGRRDITFLAFGDTQVSMVGIDGCKQKDGYRKNQNRRMVRALNGMIEQLWPEGHGFLAAGKRFRRIRGVLVAGDITENGSEPLPGSDAECPEWERFESLYGVCGERRLRYPVYEGFGNHDFPYMREFDSDYHPVVDLIDARNPVRPNVVQVAAPTEAHYAWRWDDIDFINLNVKPGGTAEHPALEDVDRGPRRKRRVNPHRALDFLDDYLGSPQVQQGAQVVMMSHYGPTDGDRFDRQERVRLCSVLDRHRREKGVRIVAWLHGHTHKSDFYRWRCPEPYDRLRIPIFNVGSPYYGSVTNDGNVHFGVFRLTNRRLEAVDVSVRRTKYGNLRYRIPGESTTNHRSRFNPDGVWGGWSVVLRDHLRPPRD